MHPFPAHVVGAAPDLAWLVDPERPVGLVIGNTRALWPRVLAAYADDPTLRGAADPLDRYVERAITAALPDARVVFGHRTYAGAFVPIQRAAAAAGMGVLTPAHLLVHPRLGPWLALRAVALCPGVAPVLAPAPEIPDAHTAAGDAAFAAALAATGPDAWRAWLAVRDACPRGREHRYSDAQIRYHYTHDRAALEGAISPGDSDRPAREPTVT